MNQNWVLKARFHLLPSGSFPDSKKKTVENTSNLRKAARRMAEEDPLADPVAVIVTLQQYQKKLSSQVELLRQDVATSKTFQSKYGVRPTGVVLCVCLRNLCGTRQTRTGHTRAWV